jgi:hypothetical protein
MQNKEIEGREDNTLLIGIFKGLIEYCVWIQGWKEMFRSKDTLKS